MDVREYLVSYNEIGDEIRRLNSELNRLLECREETYNTLQAQFLSGMPVSHRPESEDIISKAAILVIRRFRKGIENLTVQINRLLDQQDLFNDVWNNKVRLSFQERQVIELEYFNPVELKWDEIGKKMNYSPRHCERLAASAIKKLQEAIDV